MSDMTRLFQYQKQLSILVSIVSTLSVSCGGSVEFAGSVGQDLDAKANRDLPAATSEQSTPLPTKPLKSLSWFFQCESAPVDLPAGDLAGNQTVEGTGPHEFDFERLKGTPISVQGRLCEPERMKRDIVFIIDTSGSMSDSDPRSGDTCARRQAMEQVMSNLAGKDSHFGLVTFSGQVGASSQNLFASPSDLYNDVTVDGLRSEAEIICGDLGGTNYQVALESAERLLSNGRRDATKEIYLVSDGQPEEGVEGIATAARLKTSGITAGSVTRPATIATVMLAGIDEYMEKFIASKDEQGQPLHAFASETSQLVKVLSELARNAIVGGVLQWRPIGTQAYTSIDIGPYTKDFDFVLPPFSIDIATAPLGVEVVYQYKDKHDNRYETSGKLLWTAVTDTPSSNGE